MISTLASDPDLLTEHFVVSHGKSGALGHFIAGEPLPLRRGDRVIVDSSRGRELGTVLCPATVRQARLLGAESSGTIVRAVTGDDEIVLNELRTAGHRLFVAGRHLAEAQAVPIEILDVDVLFDGCAIVQFVSPEGTSLDAFAGELSIAARREVRLESLALPKEAPAQEGCGKPDCGKVDGGGCSTCSTGGGCSSCGSKKTDLREYFGHLRTQMDGGKRTPLA